MSPVIAALLFMGVLLLVGCCGGGYFLVRRLGPFQAASDLPAAVAAYRRTGLPWEAKDLAPQPPVPDSQNAAPLIHRCTVALHGKKLDASIEQIIDLEKGGKFEQAAKLLHPFKDQIGLANQAVRLGKADFHYDWDLGPARLLPDLKTFKDLAKLLACDALVSAGHGHVEAAIDELRNTRKLADLCGQEPDLIAYLVQIAVSTICARFEQQCASIFVRNPSALRALAKLEEEPQQAPDFARALRGEAYTLIATCRNFLQLGGLDMLKSGLDEDASPPRPLNPKQLNRGGLPSDTMARGFLDKSLRFWVEADQILTHDKGDARRASQELDRLSAKYSNMHSMSDILMAEMSPVYGQAGDAGTRLAANRLVTQALVKAMVIHAETGSFPTSLSQIPGKWIDPYSGAPLLLRPKTGEFRVYSIGPTGVDDGGIDQRELPKNLDDKSHFDVVAAYPMPKKP